MEWRELFYLLEIILCDHSSIYWTFPHVKFYTFPQWLSVSSDCKYKCFLSADVNMADTSALKVKPCEHLDGKDSSPSMLEDGHGSKQKPKVCIK